MRSYAQVAMLFYLLIAISLTSSTSGFRSISLQRYQSLHTIRRCHDTFPIRYPFRRDMTVADMTESMNEVIKSSNSRSNGDRFINFMKNLWDFSRPHTLIGSTLSLLSLYAFATPMSTWLSSKFLYSFLYALVPSLAMNIYITGLNQLTDVDIDKINKPYLPIASGKLSQKRGTVIVISSLILSLLFAIKADPYLRLTLLGSGILGTLYSLPPFRLKRFPLLAAICILVVRGSLVNLGFYLSSKVSILDASIPSIRAGITQYPESGLITIFFAIFGVVIALMKDVPDVAGDVVGKIPSFSVQLGPKRMLR
jgi:homogentisate phytyltransferase / homogentisate geranylgeranyltransferase